MFFSSYRVQMKQLIITAMTDPTDIPPAFDTLVCSLFILREYLMVPVLNKSSALVLIWLYILSASEKIKNSLWTFPPLRFFLSSSASSLNITGMCLPVLMSSGHVYEISPSLQTRLRGSASRRSSLQKGQVVFVLLASPRLTAEIWSGSSFSRDAAFTHVTEQTPSFDYH